MGGPKRKTFVAREDLLVRLGKLAKIKGFTLYETVNEIIELAIKAEEEGLNLNKIIEENTSFKRAKDLGFILGLENLWYDLSDIVHEKVKKKSLDLWYETGIWLAKRYITGDVDNSFSDFKKDLKAFNWNIPEFTIEENEEKITIQIVNPKFSSSYSVLLASFLKGSLTTFGYEVIDSALSRGLIRINALRKENYA